MSDGTNYASPEGLTFAELRKMLFDVYDPEDCDFDSLQDMIIGYSKDDFYHYHLIAKEYLKLSATMSTCCSCGYTWPTGTDGTHSCSSVLQKTIKEAVELAVSYGSIDGAHHKDWVINQMVIKLTGAEYGDVVKNACSGGYEWSCGIAP